MAVESNERIVEYLKKNLKKGYTEESLKWALIQQGHSRAGVSKAIETVKKELSNEKSNDTSKEKPKITHEFYDSENRKIEVEVRKPFSLTEFFKRLFS